VPFPVPLFPLRTVLFPGALLPLHIFEPRYRQLLADLSALEARDRTFVLLPPGPEGGLPEPGAVGCLARLRGAQYLPDGRANIVVSGERRVSFQSHHPSPAPYFKGLIRWLEDEPDIQVPSEQEVSTLRTLGIRYAEARHTLEDRTLEVDLPRDPAALSFAIAGFLEWDFEALQHFLEMRSASARVTRLLAALPLLVSSTEARATVHDRAKRNGHGTPA
jgi:Lon protease-like protein